jgi:hypothetical protein
VGKVVRKVVQRVVRGLLILVRPPPCSLVFHPLHYLFPSTSPRNRAFPPTTIRNRVAKRDLRLPQVLFPPLTILGLWVLSSLLLLPFPLGSLLMVFDEGFDHCMDISFGRVVVFLDVCVSVGLQVVGDQYCRCKYVYQAVRYLHLSMARWF